MRIDAAGLQNYAFDGNGYETRLAESDDLLHWRQKGYTILHVGDTFNVGELKPKLTVVSQLSHHCPSQPVFDIIRT